jgi:hypothetical protein
VQAHILVCFLALALWRVLEQWMASKGLGTCARQLLKELDELHSLDVVLPTDSGVELRLRVVAQPEKELAQLLAPDIRCGPALATLGRVGWRHWVSVVVVGHFFCLVGIWHCHGLSSLLSWKTNTDTRMWTARMCSTSFFRNLMQRS